MSERLLIRRHLDGRPVVVVASRGAAISALLHSPGGNIRKTIDSALAGLPDDPEPAPVSATSWLRIVAIDRRLRPMTLRAAMIIALTAEGTWIGQKALASDLGISPKNVWRTVEQLVELGFLKRHVDGRHVIYARRLP